MADGAVLPAWNIVKQMVYLTLRCCQIFGLRLADEDGRDPQGGWVTGSACLLGLSVNRLAYEGGSQVPAYRLHPPES